MTRSGYLSFNGPFLQPERPVSISARQTDYIRRNLGSSIRRFHSHPT